MNENRDMVCEQYNISSLRAKSTLLTECRILAGNSNGDRRYNGELVFEITKRHYGELVFEFDKNSDSCYFQ
ncbi:MAG: hypothetical protein HYT61_01335 [Candidatus Yanofskybacteria bacterium]|nr:hypothetical protein [Candidatus Yanofskybacteria bacterium]